MGIQRPPLPKCPRCEKTIRAGDLFCRHCGLPLEAQRSRSRGLRRIGYVAAVIGTAAVSAVVIAHALTTPIASGPTPQARGQSIAVSQPAATASAANSQAPSSSSSSSGTWSTRSVRARGVGFSVQLPTNWIQSPLSRPGHWLWTAPNGVGKVTLAVKTYQNPSATESLGPNAYGTPITTLASGVASQQLDVKWAPHHWLWVTMKVPKSQISELGTIARSVNIS